MSAAARALRLRGDAQELNPRVNGVVALDVDGDVASRSGAYELGGLRRRGRRRDGGSFDLVELSIRVDQPFVAVTGDERARRYVLQVEKRLQRDRCLDRAVRIEDRSEEHTSEFQSH